VWRYRSEKGRLVIDVGFGGTWRLGGLDKLPKYAECIDVMSGRQARIATLVTAGELEPHGMLFAGAYWPLDGPVTVTAYGDAVDRETHEKLLGMIRSIRFNYW